MKPIAKFELLTRGQSSDEALTSSVIFAGKQVHCELAGSHLDAQFQCSLGFLLLSNENNPYEEALHITLLSPSFNVLDTLEISHMYASGLVQNLQVVDENALEFEFFGEDSWRLTVLEKPQYWSLKQLTPGIVGGWKRLLRKGYLSLRRLDID